MTGSAISVSMITDAPTMPVVAAMMVPRIVTASASPPGMRRNKTCNVCNNCSATFDFSSIVPMKMNIGIATNTWLSTACA